METTKVKIAGTDYQVKFPDVSEHMEIEALKQTYTNGKYGEMVRAGVRTTDRNLDMVDALCTFSVLIPDLRINLEKPSLFKLEIKQGLQVAKAYLEDYLPWYNKIMTELDEMYKNLVNESTAETTNSKG